MTIKQINHGTIQKVCHLHNGIFHFVFLDTNICINNPYWQSSDIIFLCKYYIAISDTLATHFDQSFTRNEKSRRKDWVCLLPPFRPLQCSNFSPLPHYLRPCTPTFTYTIWSVNKTWDLVLFVISKSFKDFQRFNFYFYSCFIQIRFTFIQNPTICIICYICKHPTSASIFGENPHKRYHLYNPYTCFMYSQEDVYKNCNYKHGKSVWERIQAFLIFGDKRRPSLLFTLHGRSLAVLTWYPIQWFRLLHSISASHCFSKCTSSFPELWKYKSLQVNFEEGNPT